MTYIVTVLTHKVYKGKNLDGSDTKFGKGVEKEIEVTAPRELSEGNIEMLARRKVPSLCVSKIISIKEK